MYINTRTTCGACVPPRRPTHGRGARAALEARFGPASECALRLHFEPLQDGSGIEAALALSLLQDPLPAPFRRLFQEVLVGLVPAGEASPGNP